MKKVLKLIIGLAAVLTIFLIVLPVQAVAPTTETFKITNSISQYPYKPDVYDNVLVYEAEGDNITIVDITNPSLPIVSSSIIDGRVPQIYNNKIVYSKNGDIYVAVINLNNLNEAPVTYRITDTAEVTDNYPRIDGNNLVWQSDNTTLNCADITTIQNLPQAYTVAIATGESGELGGYDVYEDIVFWSDNHSGDYDVYMTDISNKDSIPAATVVDAKEGSSQIEPRVSGGYAVWSDDSSGTLDIYYASIDNLNNKVLIDFGEDLLNPVTDGKYIVWMGVDDTIGGYEIETQEAFDVFTGPSGGFEQVEISGGKVVLDPYDPQNYDFSDIYLVTMPFGSASDSTPPTFSTLPGDTKIVNLTEGELIKTNPYIIKVKPNDDIAVEKVEFYVDGNLICTDTTADSEGIYSCSWDTSKYHSNIRVVAYDTSGNTVELTRSVVVDPSLYTLPKTGMNLLDYLRLIFNNVLQIISL